MKGKVRQPNWAIPSLVLAMALGALAVVACLSHFGGTPAEADIDPAVAVTIRLTDTNLGVASGYTVAAGVSGAAVASPGTITVTFPAGTTGLGALTVADGAFAVINLTLPRFG